MAREDKPAMPFYGRDFYDDENVLVMTLEQQGAYVKLLWKCWSEGSIPSDEAKLAAMLGITSATCRKIWKALEGCFTSSGERLIHGRVEAIRQEFNNYSSGQSKRGKKGAEARWRKHGGAIKSPASKHTSATGNPMASDCISEKQPPSPFAETEPKRVPDSLAEAFHAVRELHDPGDGDDAGRLFVAMVLDGRITEADAPLMAEGMRRWLRSEDWAIEKRFMPAGPAKDFRFRLYRWIEARAWTKNPKPSTEALAEDQRGEFWVPPQELQ